MSLATYWQACREGKTVTFRPRGNSMRGLVASGDQVVVRPCIPARLEVGDIVLVRVKGSIYLHKVVQLAEGKWLIGNNRGGTNGWVREPALAGICVSVEGKARPRLEGKVAGDS